MAVNSVFVELFYRPRSQPCPIHSWKNQTERFCLCVIRVCPLQLPLCSFICERFSFALSSICSSLTKMCSGHPFQISLDETKYFPHIQDTNKTNTILASFFFFLNIPTQFWLRQQGRLPRANPSVAQVKKRRRKRRKEGGDRQVRRIKGRRKEGRRWKGNSNEWEGFCFGSSLWILLLLHHLTSETFTSPELPLMSALLSMHGFIASQHCFV